MSNINAQALKVDDINQTYDLLVTHFTANAEIANGNKPEDHAVSVLAMHLKKIGYAQADHVATFIRNYVAKRTRENGAAATSATARKGAMALFASIVGKETAAETPVSAPAQPVAARTVADGDDQTKTGDAAPAEPAFETSGLSELTIADDAAAGIDAQLAALTSSRVRSVRDVVAAIAAAEKLVGDMTAAIKAGREKLAAHKAGDHEAANEIAFELPVFKASGLGDVKLEGPMVAGLDALMKLATGGKVAKVADLFDAVVRAEKVAAEKIVVLRSLARDIRAAQPRERKTVNIATGAAAGAIPQIECEVEMRKASEIFTNAFGHSSPILDFEVPVLHFVEPHPDVPKVDDTFRFYAPVLADVLDCIVENEIPWLYGESGCGKSELFAQVAARLGFPLIRLNMDSHLTRADLVGTNRLVPGPTGAPIMQFIPGAVPNALMGPSLLLIDEMDLGDPEIMPVLQPILEGKGIRLLEDGGRYIEPHPWSRIAATANTIGLGSQNQMYLNAHEQSAATRDRISRFIEMPYLPADKELEVVMARVPYADRDFAEKVIQLANKARDAYRLNEIHQVFSTRTVVRAVKRHARFAPIAGDPMFAVHSTLDVTVLNRCDPDSRSVMVGLRDAIFV